MIKRLIEYLTIERKIEYIQYKNSLKSNNARNYINYSTLKTISIKISTKFLLIFTIHFKNSKYLTKIHNLLKSLLTNYSIFFSIEHRIIERLYTSI